MASGNGTLAEQQQLLRGELAEFRQTMMADISQMFECHFERHQHHVRHLLEPTHRRTPPHTPNAGAVSTNSDNFTQKDANCSQANEPNRPAVNTGETDSEGEDVVIKPITGVFGDLGTSDKINLTEKTYDVMNYYKTEGCSQRVARHHWFSDASLAVICANAIYLGVDADNNTEGYILDSHIGFQICEHLFCVFFTGELLFRFLAFKHKRNCIKDNWFKFDGFLVFMMVTETWCLPALFSIIGGTIVLPTGPLRLLRLLRLSRLVRLIRTLPELLTMFKGMFVASRAVGSSLLMVLLLVYVFGIIVHMGASKEPGLDHKFGTLPRCMWTLLMDGTFMDNTGTLLTGLIERAKFNTIATAVVFLTFILLSAMTVMNMLIGVLCEVVSAVAQGERDEAAIHVMKETILVELKQFDNDGNGNISKDELGHVLKNKQALGVLRSIDVGADCLLELQQMLFYGKGDDAEVSIDRVMELLLHYRGNLQTTVKHMVEAQAFNRWCLTNQMKVHNDHLAHYLRHLNSVLCSMVPPSCEEVNPDRQLSFAARAEQHHSLIRSLQPQAAPLAKSVVADIEKLVVL